AGSDLNALVVIAPDIFKAEEQLKDGRKNSSTIKLVNLLPIYEQETLTIQRIGLPGFLSRIGDQKLNPNRGIIE
ncbi:MAG: hypothetical protein ACRDE7_03775, partial [Sphingobacterium sp.]